MNLRKAFKYPEQWTEFSCIETKNEQGDFPRRSYHEKISSRDLSIVPKERLQDLKSLNEEVLNIFYKEFIVERSCILPIKPAAESSVSFQLKSFWKALFDFVPS